jgi:hypothetical protein
MYQGRFINKRTNLVIFPKSIRSIAELLPAGNTAFVSKYRV